MDHYRSAPDTGQSRAEQFLTYAGAVGIAIAVLLTGVVLLLTMPESMLPTGPVLSTLVFTVMTLLVAAVVQRLGRQRRP